MKLPSTTPPNAAQLFLACACAVSASVAAAEPAPFMMSATLGSRTIEGQPVAWNKRQLLLLGRDGALYDVDPAAAKDAKRTASRYQGYTTGEMKARLREEFDRAFDLTATSHFIVVHPRGALGDWAQRLESLYRSFTHYVSVRGFPVQSPPAPLVAVLFRNQADYFAHAAAAGTPLRPGTLGHYDPESNRVFLFDLAPAANGADGDLNAETIIHEATHQAAYNVGVHNRFAEQPRWLVEGLAMMFEARGVWDAASLHEQADRINRYRLDAFRKGAAARTADWLPRLVSSDRPFQTDALTAYAEAWALTFYLYETRPQEYSSYLVRAADRQLFAAYPPADRLADFAHVFGADWSLLEAQVGRYIAKLP